MSIVRRVAGAGLIALGLLFVSPVAARAADDPNAADARSRVNSGNGSPPTSAPGGPLGGPVRDLQRWLSGGPGSKAQPPTGASRPPQSGGSASSPNPQPTPSPAPTPTPQPAPSRRAGTSSELKAVALIIAIVVAAALAYLVYRTMRNRSDRSEGEPVDDEVVPDIAVGLAELLDPDTVGISEAVELERLADDAEARGAFSRAVRLRFRAGLLRLDDEHLVPYERTWTTGQYMHRLRNATFNDIAIVFDRTLYGRVPATADDAVSARVGWPHVIVELRTTLAGHNS